MSPLIRGGSKAGIILTVHRDSETQSFFVYDYDLGKGLSASLFKRPSDCLSAASQLVNDKGLSASLFKRPSDCLSANTWLVKGRKTKDGDLI